MQAPDAGTLETSADLNISFPTFNKNKLTLFSSLKMVTEMIFLYNIGNKRHQVIQN